MNTLVLNKTERLFVQLRWGERLSLAEIAAVLELDVAAVGAIDRDVLERARAYVAARSGEQGARSRWAK